MESKEQYTKLAESYLGFRKLAFELQAIAE